MNVSKPASEPQVNEPAAPPVDRMYDFPMLTKLCTFAAATALACNPPQFSLPHSPVANAQVTAPRFVGMTVSRPCMLPVTAVLITFVFQFMLIVMSL